jgi:hypothetical protein
VLSWVTRTEQSAGRPQRSARGRSARGRSARGRSARGRSAMVEIGSRPVKPQSADVAVSSNPLLTLNFARCYSRHAT